MGIEQERNGGEREWLGRRPGLRRLRVLGFRSLWSDAGQRPECSSMRLLQGNGLETGVPIRKVSCLGSSHWLAPFIWQLHKTGNGE